MEKWQSGDMSAFEALFRQYERLVFQSAYLMMGRREEAEDVLQEVFVSVWKSRHTFNPAKGKLTTWLHRITVNECMRKLRKSQPAPVFLENMDLLRLPEEPEEMLMKEQQSEKLMAAVNLLDSKHRSVLVLRYFSELSYDEIAQAAGIPLGTVKSRLNQALKLLRQQLGAQQGEAST